MTWTVTLHPALTGDVAALAPSEKSALILDLLTLEQDGGHYFQGLPYPSTLPHHEIWQYRFSQSPHALCLLAMSGSWVEHEVCVLGLLIPSAEQDAAVMAEWIGTIRMRQAKVKRDSTETLSLQRFLDIFPLPDVEAAEQKILQQIPTKSRRETIALATELMRSDVAALFNFSKTRQQLFERRYDFMMQSLQQHLGAIGAKVTLTIEFPDESFAFEKLESLPTQKSPPS